MLYCSSVIKNCFFLITEHIRDMSQQTSTDNIPLSQMMQLLKERTRAFNEKFDKLKTEYDDLSDKRSDILKDVADKTKQLQTRTQKYQSAMKEYKKAQIEKSNAEFDIYLSLNAPDSLVYSPQCNKQHSSITNIDSSVISRISEELQTQHYAIIDNFLTESLTKELYKEVKLMHINDELKLGKTGGGRAGEEEKINGNRFDLITYVNVDTNDEKKQDNQTSELHNQDDKSSFTHFVDNLDGMIHELCHNIDDLKNKVINRGNVMVSCYEKDAYYISHVDNPNNNGRVLTALLYLNPSWQKSDGGELQIHRCGSKTHS